jgi:hypothetical protein
MRKNETLEAEAARKKREAELPLRIAGCSNRVAALCEKVIAAIQTVDRRNRTNPGGEKSGTLE